MKKYLAIIAVGLALVAGQAAAGAAITRVADRVGVRDEGLAAATPILAVTAGAFLLAILASNEDASESD